MYVLTILLFTMYTGQPPHAQQFLGPTSTHLRVAGTRQESRSAVAMELWSWDAGQWHKLAMVRRRGSGCQWGAEEEPDAQAGRAGPATCAPRRCAARTVEAFGRHDRIRQTVTHARANVNMCSAMA